jgi:hypothetical protein
VQIKTRCEVFYSRTRQISARKLRAGFVVAGSDGTLQVLFFHLWVWRAWLPLCPQICTYRTRNAVCGSNRAGLADSRTARKVRLNGMLGWSAALEGELAAIPIILELPPNLLPGQNSRSGWYREFFRTCIWQKDHVFRLKIHVLVNLKAPVPSEPSHLE